MATKKSSRPRPAAAEETPVRQRILEAAFSAFMELGFAEASTLEIATRARVSKRELYALFGNKQDMLVACISERARRLQIPADLPELCDRETLARTLTTFGMQLLRETGDPIVVAVFRLAIAEAVRAPEVAQVLNERGVEASRAALREIMTEARSAGLLGGRPIEMAEHFAGLLWGNQMLVLLLHIADQPSAREIARRAEAATAAFLRLYPQPDKAQSPD
ncbi:MAG: TetR/AcrR family transcriptional regulator [Bradyrhizobium sp.]|jgi:AcrR family transcriptional regulator|nr:TetR/AcrR family transcriptional regulator [Bradyrhizobium sp.]